MALQKSRPNGPSLHSHITAKEWHGFRRHKPGQPRPYNPQNGQPDRLLGGDPDTIAVVNNMGTVLAGGTGIWDYQNLELTNSGTIKSDYLGVSSTGTTANINNSGYIWRGCWHIYVSWVVI